MVIGDARIDLELFGTLKVKLLYYTEVNSIKTLIQFNSNI